MYARYLSKLSIRNKLIGMILLTSITVLSIGFTFIVFYDILTYREQLVSSAQLIAAVTGSSIIGELTFSDPAAATDTLSKLREIPNITNAYVFDVDNRLFVRYDKSGADRMTPPAVRPPSWYFARGSLHLYHPITFQDQKYGMIYLRLSTEDMDQKIQAFLTNMMISVAVLVVISYALAYVLQGLVSKPILGLATVTQRVSRDGNYSVRVRRGSDDEIGTLYDGFNEMLVQIDRRDRERSRIESELKRAQAFLENVIESMPSILIAIDMDGTVAQWNQAAMRLTGISASEALGKNLWEIVPYLGKYRDQLRAVVETRRIRDIYKDPLQIGSVRYFFNVSLFPLVADGHEGVVIMADNVTEMEAKEQQLRQAQKMETIGTLAGGLAHDFNNVLGGIIGALSLMRFKIQKSGPLPPADLAKYLNAIGESADRAAALVQQLLSLCRKRELTFTSVDLNRAIQHVMTICQNTFDKSIDLQVMHAGEGAWVSADPTQIEQVLLNLCVNASHAMTIMRREGEHWGGRLTAGLRKVVADPDFRKFHPEAQPGTYWCLSVTDEGVGMDPPTVARMFDPFFTTKSKEVGTGLGLTMVYNIVQQQGGFLDVDSEPGAGTTFNVYLPALGSSQPEAEASDDDRGIIRGEGLVLIVDDEPLMRQMAQESLESCGYSVVTAPNGQAGVSLFKERRSEIALVLLDLVMPKMSGTEAFQEMKQIDPSVKVLLASGFQKDERVEEAMSLGVRGFIEKPYTMKALSRAVNQAIHENEQNKDTADRDAIAGPRQETDQGASS